MMSWFTRNIARTLFAEPPSSSIEEALEHFEVSAVLAAQTSRTIMARASHADESISHAYISWYLIDLALCLAIVQRAESISPGFWKKNQVMIAQCMKQLGRKEEAREWAQKATQIRTLTHEDEEAEAEAQKLLSSLG